MAWIVKQVMNLTVSLQNKQLSFLGRRSLIKFLAALILSATTLFSPAIQADERVQAAENHIFEMIENVRSKSNMSLTDAERQELFMDAIHSYFDVDGIVRYTAGRYWRAASDTERAEYKALFLDIMTASAASQFSALMELDFIPSNTIPRGDKLVLVRGTIKDKRGEIPDAAVAWRVAVVKSKPPRIIDIEVENVSMLKTQQDENTAIIRKNGGKFSALITELKARQNKAQASN